MCNNNKAKLLAFAHCSFFIRKLCNFMHIITMHHAEQWSSHQSHHTPQFRVRFRLYTPADIEPHPVPARFKKFESGKSLL